MRRTDDERIYPSPAGTLAALRKEHRSMKDREFLEAYEYFHAGAFIEARFTAAKLSYLAVTRVESD